MTVMPDPAIVVPKPSAPYPNEIRTGRYDHLLPHHSFRRIFFVGLKFCQGVDHAIDNLFAHPGLLQLDDFRGFKVEDCPGISNLLDNKVVSYACFHKRDDIFLR